MKTPANHIRLLALFSLALAAVAQLRKPTPDAPSQKPRSDEAIQLSPFTVSGGSTNGYIASETTTGTRVATKIADLPFVVNVITSEFLNDFNFFDIGENLAYTSSLSGADEEGNYFLRGFPATFYLWNGFYRLGVIDRFDIDRIEIIKGPNASIYGQTSPAGILNIVTKTPTSNPHEDIRFTYGSYDLGRVEGHVNTPLGSIGKIRVFNLASFGGYDRTYDTASRIICTAGDLEDALKLQFNDHSDLTTTVEWTKRLYNSGTASAWF